jgi:hypothetical protein
VGSHAPCRMDEWTSLDVKTATSAESEAENEVMTGLGIDAPALQAAFENRPSHLDEVKQRHLEVLVTAGMLPETGLADVHPDRALAWVVEGINGRVAPDGLTIPLLGTSPEQVHVKTKITEEATMVQLTVEDGEHPDLVRHLPLPTNAATTLEATFSDGRLHLRW